jgi:glycosyltransferase involved in cell wall biosynthesis
MAREKVKIVFLRFSSIFGGVESHIFLLTSSLKSDGHHPVLIFRDKDLVARAISLGLDARYIKKRFKLDIFFLLELKKVLNEIRPDIVHSHGILSDFCASLLLKKRHGKKANHVITVHSLPWIGFGLGKFKAFIYQKMHLASMKHVDAVIVVSKWLEEELSKNIPIKEKINIVHNGIDIKKYEPLSHSRLGKRGKKPMRIVIGYAGRFSREKGLDTLLHAFSLIKQNHLIQKEIHGILIGDGREKKPIEKLIRALNLSRWIELKGFRNDVEKVLADFDIFVLPSITEGLPMILLEAGAMGIPVVATWVGGIPELIQSGVEGLLVSPGDSETLASAIARLANTPSMRNEMGKNLHSKVKDTFNLEKMTKATLKIYGSILP